MSVDYQTKVDDMHGFKIQCMSVGTWSLIGDQEMVVTEDQDVVAGRLMRIKTWSLVAE